jgi:nucleoside-diphosphate-sugar epimerase
MVTSPNPLAADLDHVLAHTEHLWGDLRGARLFVTGGTGFFGCWLLETLLWANDRLELDASAVVLTRNGPAFTRKAPHLAGHSAVTLHPGDVRTFAFPEGSFSHVIHAATDSGIPLAEQDRLQLFDTIVEGTRRTLEFTHQSRASRLLFTSSGAVYGRQPSELTHVPEDFPGGPDPTDRHQVYGEGKRAAESLCALFASASLQPTIARCFAFVGPYLPLDAHFAAGNFIRDALNGGPIHVKGDGTPYRSYLYAADLAIWLWTILLKGAPMRPYNAGSEEAVTIAELASFVGGIGDVGVRLAQHRIPGRAPERYVPSTRRAAGELALRPTIAVESALQRTMAWHLKAALSR